MGILADSLFSALMSWVRALVNALWALFSADHTTVLEFLGKHWLLIAVVLIGAGLVIDWIIWLMRWQPYHLWAQRVRRLLGGDQEDEDEEEEELRAHAAVTRGRSYARPAEPEERDAFFPPQPFEADMSEADERAAMQQADSVPDEELGAYPGMRYDGPAAGSEAMTGTQRYSAVQAQGPGAAEVERRRAEIDAWQLQMQEEARARAEAERAAREAEQARLAQEAYEAEQARLAQEAYEAEQARLAQEAQAAYEAEQARLAQEEYQRQLAEYERQKVQYERDLAEYERQKAVYEAQLATQQAQEMAAQQSKAQQDEVPAVRRRRSVKRTYSDYVEGEAVGELPDAPQWPKMQHVRMPEKAQEQTQEEPAKKGNGLLGRMARMIEPEEEELITRRSLPPRIDPGEAFHTAKMPVISDKRKKR